MSEVAEEHGGEPVPLPPLLAFEVPELEAVEVALESDAEPGAEPMGSAAPTVRAQIRADVSEQWSWASSAARVPQIWDLSVDVSEAIRQARILVSVCDADIEFGSTAVEIPLTEGTTRVGSVHVPLSARVMSQVDERRSAECVIELKDASTDLTLARRAWSIDVQPRDLWLWSGDPRRAGHAQDNGTWELSRSLLASFVRPNHPEIAVIARAAAEQLGLATEDPSFFAFQIEDVGEAEQRADDTVEAIYTALQQRAIAYSEPPPGWDYQGEGQRIRDHGEVARGGLGTCMDTTVLMAAVIEHVGLFPVLVLMTGHIFVGYWRRDPRPKLGPNPEWYPDTPVVADPARIRSWIEGGWLGIIETTAFTVSKHNSPGDARLEARYERLPLGLNDGSVNIIDVLAARHAGVSPLPAINRRADGVTEIIEYRPSGAPTVTEVHRESVGLGSQQRQVDNHPARYRTWKASLFSLDATSDLLNLKKNAKVQPLVLPPEGLAVLEDQLHQDVSFSLLSGAGIPEVWKARGFESASDLLERGSRDDRRDLIGHLNDRIVYVQRNGRSGDRRPSPSQATFSRETRSMAHSAKIARDEFGMNPLYLCLGLLGWEHKPGIYAEAPLILVPVNISVPRGGQEFTLSLDSSQHTTPNAALIEWLRREHGLAVPGLAEPLTDRAGIDVDGLLAEVRTTVAERGLPFSVKAEARLAILDLSAFRMWTDLNLNAESFLERPLVRHLVHTPTENFEDPAVEAARGTASDEALEDELEELETPVSADSTQKRAVLWARQGRTFVLQGPPGTGKSQTITNMVAECISAGLRVLFVAEKGTALAVVQRRLDAIGLDPFTLNLHHEGSNATEVRAQLKTALTAAVTPDPTAMESARRRLRNSRYELTRYPQQLHVPNAAGLSAYGAHDELLVLQDGPTIPVPTTLVARQADQVAALKELFQDLPRWTSAAGVRPDHPWRLAGAGSGDPFDVEAVSAAVRGILTGLTWVSSTSGTLRGALDEITHPAHLSALAAAASSVLVIGDDVAGVLDAVWPTRAPETVAGCEGAVEGWGTRLHGFSPQVLGLDLRAIASQLEAATSSGFLGRKKRLTAAVAPLAAVAPPGVEVKPDNAGVMLADLIAVQDTAAQVRASLGAVPGLARTVPANPFTRGAFAPVWARLNELATATAGLRDGSDFTQRARSLAQTGHLAGHADALSAYATSWQQLWETLLIQEAEFQAWRKGETLAAATGRSQASWRRDVDYERLMPLQRWCTLIGKLEPLRTAGLEKARLDLLEGQLPADIAEEALARGIARASLSERIAAAGLDRFDAVAHDQRVASYSEAEQEARNQWVTDGPARVLDRRGGGGLGSDAGGLARELEKTTRKLTTRMILRKYGEVVQELTPLVLCSPSSAVDLIDPAVMGFDVVIFDEASQITVPEAVGALGRARAAIVVGDSKQMPPTRTFGGQQAGDEEEIDDPDVEEILEDQESILSECELARVPTLSLNWHYRSQDEELIAFSNRAYYHGELSSFPTPTLLSVDTGMEFRRVDGQYHRAGSGKIDLGQSVVAGSNTNPAEAQAIVQAVQDLVNRSVKLPSIGIVTFNEQQRQLIDDLLNASRDPKVAEVMDEATMGRGEVLFVKALEQVQGDERDTMIFSISFSKQANGKIPTNFGPLSNSGGERRLNVAITRARRKNIVFCSFEPEELDVSDSAFEGPKDLKKFLIFAKSATSTEETGRMPDRIAIRDRHRDDIAAALRDAGLHVMADVGLSNFRLDLVLSRPENPGRLILPILLDGESWRKRATVSDRDVLPVHVLHNLMGWPTVARIWWPMWLQNRDEVITRVLAEVDRAEAALNETASRERTPAVPAETTVASMPSTPEPETTTAASPATPTTDEPVTPSPFSPGNQAAAPSHQVPEPAEAPPEPVEEPTPFVPHEPPAVARPGASAPPTSPTAPDRRGANDTDAVGEIKEFEPAHTNLVGSKDVLDALPDRTAAAAVREQVLEVIDAEGPVELSRLIHIVAWRFGLNAVRAARADDIERLIPHGQLRTSHLGSFVWPAHLDPATWTGFRTVDPDASRTLDEIAPEEILNAMRYVIAEQGDLSDEDVLRRTGELFGTIRLGANVRTRLEAEFNKLRH